MATDYSSINISKLDSALSNALTKELEAVGIDEYELSTNVADDSTTFIYPTNRADEALEAAARALATAPVKAAPQTERQALEFELAEAIDFGAPAAEIQAIQDKLDKSISPQVSAILSYLKGNVQNIWRVGADELQDVSLDDLQVVADACASGDYEAAHKTNLYQEHGFVYTNTLCIAYELGITPADAATNDPSISAALNRETEQRKDVTKMAETTTSKKGYDGVLVSMPKQIAGKDATRPYSITDTETGEIKRRMELTMPPHTEINGKDVSFYRFTVKDTQVKEFANDPNYFHVAFPKANRAGEAWNVTLKRDFGGYENPDAATPGERGAWVSNVDEVKVDTLALKDAMEDVRESRREFAREHAKDAPTQGKDSPAAAKDNAARAAASVNSQTKAPTPEPGRAK